ncbi:MAG: hypothetical protein IJZ94_00080 [Clostridia bacterium]|nr:hypothetical protein [Clostridia bacterium]
MDNINNEEKNKVLKITALNTVTVVVCILLALFFAQLGNSFTVQTVLATTESALPQSTADPNTGVSSSPAVTETPATTEEVSLSPTLTEESATPENSAEATASATAPGISPTVSSSAPATEIPSQSDNTVFPGSTAQNPQETPTQNIPSETVPLPTVPTTTAPSTKAPSATAPLTQTPVSTATASATTSASILPTATPKPTLVTPSPTLARIEEPMVSGNSVIDVEAEDYISPSVTDIPAELNPDNPIDENVPEETGSASDSNKTDSKGSISALFDILVYVFVLCAIIAAIYGVFTIIKFIVDKKRSRKNSKSKKKGKKK